MAAKQWFLDLVSDYGAKAETPCVLLPGGEFVMNGQGLARLAPYDGIGMAVEPADVHTVCLAAGVCPPAASRCGARPAEPPRSGPSRV